MIKFKLFALIIFLCTVLFSCANDTNGYTLPDNDSSGAVSDTTDTQDDTFIDAIEIPDDTFIDTTSDNDISVTAPDTTDTQHDTSTNAIETPDGSDSPETGEVQPEPRSKLIYTGEMITWDELEVLKAQASDWEDM